MNTARIEMADAIRTFGLVEAELFCLLSVVSNDKEIAMTKRAEPETTTYDGHTYQRIASAPEWVVWDDHSRWNSTHHAAAFSTATIEGASDRGPGLSEYMRTEDRTTTDSDGRWPHSYWQLVR